MPKRPGGDRERGWRVLGRERGKRHSAAPRWGGASLAVPAPPQSPRGAERSRRCWGITEPGGLMVWGWWGTVGKERERRGEIPPGWSGGMRSPGARRGDRALSPVLEPRRQKWLRVGARCWSWASSVPQPPPVTACPWHRGVWGRPTAPVGCACAAPHGTAPSPFWESLRCSGSVAY